MRLFVLFASIPLILGKELIAEVRNIPDKCGLDDTIQYWINTASTARDSEVGKARAVSGGYDGAERM